jgi:CBS-domain-containing membrane protein
MDDERQDPEISAADLRAALREMRAYIDITEEDLKEIYAIALRHARGRLVGKVPVRDVMTSNVVTVKKDTDLHEAARILSEHRISGLPVVNAENHVVGIVTEADFLSMLDLDGKSAFKDVLRHILGEPVVRHKLGDKVGDIMTAPAIVIGPDVDIREAAKTLVERRIKRLPVVDEQGRLIGMIARADIVRVVAR